MHAKPVIFILTSFLILVQSELCVYDASVFGGIQNAYGTAVNDNCAKVTILFKESTNVVSIVATSSVADNLNLIYVGEGVEALSNMTYNQFNNVTISNYFHKSGGTLFQILNTDTAFFYNVSIQDSEIKSTSTFLRFTNSNLIRTRVTSIADIIIRSSNCSLFNDPNGHAIEAGASMLIDDSRFTNNTGGSTGASLCVQNDLTVSNSYFAFNQGKNGAAIFVQNVLNSMIVIANTVFERNSAERGGAIHGANPIGNWIIRDSIFRNNYASIDGAAIVIATVITVERTLFEDNSAGDSGVIFSSANSGQSEFTNCNFTLNSATAGSGGVFNITGHPVLVQDCRFLQNSANDDGGALRATNLQLFRSYFEGNYAQNGGGANGDSVYVEDCTFYQNTAKMGGGLFGMNATVVNSKFTENRNSTSASSGGAISSSNLTVTGGTFERNIAQIGGAIDTAKSQITNSTFLSNVATNASAIVFLNDLVVNQTVFSLNEGSDFGTVIGQGNASFYDCSFLRNKAARSGAVFLNSTLNLESVNSTGNNGRDLTKQFAFHATTVNLKKTTLNCDQIDSIDVYLTSDQGEVSHPWPSGGEKPCYGPDYVEVVANPTSTNTTGGTSMLTVRTLQFSGSSPFSVEINPLSVQFSSSYLDSQIYFNVGAGTGGPYPLTMSGRCIYFEDETPTFTYFKPYISFAKYNSSHLNINGTNFGASGIYQVKINGSICQNVIREEQAITCVPQLPFNSDNYEVIVNVSSLISEPYLFNYTALPTNAPTIAPTIAPTGVPPKQPNVTVFVEIPKITNSTNIKNVTDTILKAVTSYFNDTTAVNPVYFKPENASFTLGAYDLRRNTQNSSVELDLTGAVSVIPYTLIQSLNQSAFVVFFTFTENPYKFASNATTYGQVYGLSLTNKDSEELRVENSPEDISIVMDAPPSFSDEQIKKLQCLFWNETESDWSTEGCRRGDQSPSKSVQCLCNHLTNFTLGVKPSLGSQPTTNNTPIIVGVVVGVAVLLAVIVVIVLLLVRRKKSLRHSEFSEFSEMDLYNGLREEQLEMKEQVGKGAYGIVYKAILSGTSVVAVKKLTDLSHKKEFIEESNILRKLHHPNIVQFLEIFNSADGFVSIVMEFLEGGNLLTLVQSRSLSALTKLDISSQIAAALKYLEGYEIVHGDVSARNVLLGSSEETGIVVKLSDFGMARKMEQNSNRKSVENVPVRWSSPEVLSKREFSFASDVWSFGILLWEIYNNGKLPFGDNSNEEAEKLIQMGGKPPISESIEGAVAEIMLGSWEFKPKERLSIGEMASKIIVLKKQFQLELESEEDVPPEDNKLSSLLRPYDQSVPRDQNYD